MGVKSRRGLFSGKKFVVFNQGVLSIKGRLFSCKGNVLKEGAVLAQRGCSHAKWLYIIGFFSRKFIYRLFSRKGVSTWS